jgi:hypothetical protein
MSDTAPITIDPDTFQYPLAKLATTLVHKVEREGTPLLGAPEYDRPKIDESFVQLRELHVTRASVVLLSTITELQAFFHFRDANIDSRLHKLWDPILMHPVAKELYDGRYAQLMKDKGILPD